MKKRAARSSDEYLIIGLGRFGSSLALKLAELGREVLAADQDPQVTQDLSTKLAQVVALDATSIEGLAALDAGSFETAVVCIGKDFESNVLITSTLKHELGVKRVICKALNLRQKDILLRVGADEVILPEHESGVLLAHQLNSNMATVGHLELIAGLGVTALTCPPGLYGRTPRELELRKKHGVNLLMIQGARKIANPSPDEALQAGDVLVLLGSDQEVAEVAKISSPASDAR